VNGTAAAMVGMADFRGSNLPVLLVFAGTLVPPAAAAATVGADDAPPEGRFGSGKFLQLVHLQLSPQCVAF
jgi:hypothetical protein